MKAKRGQRFALGLVVAITAGFWLIYLAVDAMYWGSRDDWKGGVPTLVTHTLDADLSIFDIVGTRVVDTFSDSDITPFSPAAVPSSGATATQDLTWWLPITGGTRPPQVGPSSTSIFAPIATRTATGILPSPVTHVVTSTSGVSPSSTAMPPSVGPTSTATRPAPTATVYVPPTATTAPPPTSTTEPPPPPPTDTPDQPTRTPEPPPTEPPPTEPPPATGEPTQEGGVPAQAQYLRDDGSLLLEGRLLAQLAEMVDQWLAGIWSTASLD